jgi:hypothetical protein
MPPSEFIYNGINYTFPKYHATGNDNVLAQGQIIEVPRGKYFSVQMLAAAETGLAAGFVNGTYADGSTSSGQVACSSLVELALPCRRRLGLPLLLQQQDYRLQQIQYF